MLTISCNLQILELIGFSVLSDCDLDFWFTDLKIHRLNGRSTVYIPATFHSNSLKIHGENALQQFLRGCLLMTLTFDLRPRRFHQVVSLSWTIDQRNVRKDREISECAFSYIFRHDEISTPESYMVKLSYLENYLADSKSICSNGFSDHGFSITFSSN